MRIKLSVPIRSGASAHAGPVHLFPPGHRKSFRWHRAFTLLEIMVAMAIFSMVSLAIYSSWNAIINASRVGLQAAADAQRRRNAVNAIQDALFGVQMSTANLQHHYFLADTTDPEAALLSFVSLLPESYPGNGLFPGTPMRRVTFTLDVDRNGSRNLILYQTPVLASLDEMEDPIPIKLAENVSVFGAEFYDENLDEWLAGWENTNALPRQVRFALVFENPAQKSGQYRSSSQSSAPDLETRVVTIPSSAIPIQIQRPGIGALSGNGQPGPGQGQDPNQNPGDDQATPGAAGTGGQSTFRGSDARPQPGPRGR